MTKDEIKEQRPIKDELAAHGIHVDRAGFCRCIFHDEKTASMRIYPETMSFYCFGCQKSGDVFDVVMQLNGVNFNEAFNMLGGTRERMTDGARLRQRFRKGKRHSIKDRRKRMYDRAVKTATGCLEARRALEQCEPYSKEWAKRFAHLEYMEYAAEVTLNEWANTE